MSYAVWSPASRAGYRNFLAVLALSGSFFASPLAGPVLAERMRAISKKALLERSTTYDPDFFRNPQSQALKRALDPLGVIETARNLGEGFGLTAAADTMAAASLGLMKSMFSLPGPKQALQRSPLGEAYRKLPDNLFELTESHPANWQMLRLPGNRHALVVIPEGARALAVYTHGAARFPAYMPLSTGFDQFCEQNKIALVIPAGYEWLGGDGSYSDSRISLTPEAIGLHLPGVDANNIRLPFAGEREGMAPGSVAKQALDALFKAHPYLAMLPRLGLGCSYGGYELGNALELHGHEYIGAAFLASFGAPEIGKVSDAVRTFLGNGNVLPMLFVGSEKDHVLLGGIDGKQRDGHGADEHYRQSDPRLNPMLESGRLAAAFNGLNTDSKVTDAYGAGDYTVTHHSFGDDLVQVVSVDGEHHAIFGALKSLMTQAPIATIGTNIAVLDLLSQRYQDVAKLMTDVREGRQPVSDLLLTPALWALAKAWQPEAYAGEVGQLVTYGTHQAPLFWGPATPDVRGVNSIGLVQEFMLKRLDHYESGRRTTIAVPVTVLPEEGIEQPDAAD